MKVKAHIPGWGTAVYEASSIEVELAELRAKYPSVADEITVVDVASIVRRPLSDTELAALDEQD